MLRREPLKLTPMREPSSHGIRGPLQRGRGCLLALLALAGMFGARDAGAQAITRYVRDTGNINFVTTGGTLRNSATNTCTLNATSTQTLSGIPAGTTIRNAYLYWGGSGATAAYNDTTVTLNGTAVTASRTFARTWIQRRHPTTRSSVTSPTSPSIVNAARQRHLHVRRPHREHRHAALRQQRLSPAAGRSS